MKVLQIRNMPDDVHRELRMRAAEAGVSLSDYALSELMRISAHPSVAQVLARAGARSGGAESGAATALIRRDRDSR